MRTAPRGIAALLPVVVLTLVVGTHSPSRIEVASASSPPQQPEPRIGSLIFVAKQAPSSAPLKRLSVQAARATAGSGVVDAPTEGLPPRDEITSLCGSPNGRWTAIETALDVMGDVLIQETATGRIHPAVADAGGAVRFLDWAPDGDHLLVRIDPVGANRIGVANATDGRFEPLDTPPYTYDATLSPDGRRVLCTINRGLGFGSEVWLMDRTGSNRTQLWAEPAGRVEAFTQFDGALTAEPVWSPDGRYLAFSANSGGAADLWQGNVATGEVWPLTQGLNAQHPVWLPQ